MQIFAYSLEPSMEMFLNKSHKEIHFFSIPSIAPFLESCDLDRDHRITLKEWGKCLELEDGDLEGRCEGILVKNSAKSNEV